MLTLCYRQNWLLPYDSFLENRVFILVLFLFPDYWNFFLFDLNFASINANVSLKDLFVDDLFLLFLLFLFYLISLSDWLILLPLIERHFESFLWGLVFFSYIIFYSFVRNLFFLLFWLTKIKFWPLKSWICFSFDFELRLYCFFSIFSNKENIYLAHTMYFFSKSFKFKAPNFFFIF